MPEVRILNSNGIRLYREYLAAARSGLATEPPRRLLQEGAFSEPIEHGLTIEPTPLPTRLAAASHLHSVLEGEVAAHAAANTGLWAWLDLFYIDQTSPPDGEGLRKLGEDYRHIPSSDYRHYYRHLLLGPWQLYRLHGEGARLLLSGPLDKPGDYNEQIASRQEIAASAALIEALDILYFSEESGQPKRGAATAGRAGGLRRFVDIMQQLDLTYDLQSMTAAELLEILPREFAPWKPVSPAATPQESSVGDAV